MGCPLGIAPPDWEVPMLWFLGCAALAARPDALTTQLSQMVSASNDLRDATYTLTRTEWVGDKARPSETIAVRYRRPETLWLEWTGEVYPGRKLMYAEAWNDGKLRVRPSSFLPLFNFEPTGAVAMRDSRHPVWMSALPRIVERIAAVMDLVEVTPGLDAVFTDEGEVTEAGVRSHCYRAELPYAQDPRVYAPRVRFCGGLDSKLPTRFSAWQRVEGALQRVEDYVFADLVVNPGLAEASFDPDAL